MSLYQNFGRFCTYQEAIKSQTAVRLGLDNTPTPEQYLNLLTTYNRVYKPLCETFRKKLPISSFFRSEALNKAIGGAKTSQHLTGKAIDIDCDLAQIIGLDGELLTNQGLFQYVKKNLHFDQLILENINPDGSGGWVHISHVSDKQNRRQCLRMIQESGKTIYVPA